MSETLRRQGVFWVLSWVVCFSTAVTLTKLLGSHIPTATLIFVRSIFSFSMVFPIACQKGLKKHLKVKNKKVLIFRIINSFFAIGFTYYAYRNLPLATATSIGFSGPLFVTTFAIFMLKEKFSLKQWAYLFVGYVGVLTITNPSSIAFEVAVVSSLMANTLAGLGVNLTKILTRTEESLSLVLYNGMFNTVASFLVIVVGFLVIPSMEIYIPTGKELSLLMMIGGLGAFSGFSYIQAVKFSSPTFVAPFEYTRLLYAIPVGYIFFSEVPTLTTLFGAALIVFAVYSLTVFKRKNS